MLKVKSDLRCVRFTAFDFALPVATARATLAASATDASFGGPSAPAEAAAPAASPAAAGQDPAEALADLREVLRLGRHLLEGRQVTL